MGVKCMSMISVLPIPATGETTPAATPTDGGLIDVTADHATAQAFMAQLTDMADAPAQTDTDTPGAASDDNAGVEVPIAPDDPLEVMLQSWTGISADVSDPAPAPDDLTVLDQAASRPQTITASDMAARAQPIQPSADTAGQMPEAGLDDPLDQAVAPVASDSGAGDKPKQAVSRNSTVPLIDLSPQLLEVETAPTTRMAEAQTPAVRDHAPLRSTPHIQVIRQISQAIVATRSDQIDIALSPEELGRIHMTISGRDGGQHIVIWAERPEVLDQLRRNTTALTQEFSEAGMNDLSFEFRDDRPNHDDAEWRPAQILDPATDMPSIPVQPPSHHYTHLALGPRVDIRI